MGNWPDPVSGNKEITVVGPRADIGGVALELQALNYPSAASTVQPGMSYYFPFQVHHYWTPTAISVSNSPNGFWSSNPTAFAFVIQLGIFAEVGNNGAKRIVTTTPWETGGQATAYNLHALQSILRLPPGGYYVGYQTTSSLGITQGGFGPTSSLTSVFGVRSSASGFQSLVTDLSSSAVGILTDITIHTIV
jgi:hypothetical protein